MTKLNDAILNMYATFDWLGSLDDRATVLKAAESYAAILKLVPEIGELVEAVNQREKYHAWRVPFELFTAPTCRGLYHHACGKCEKCTYIKSNPMPDALDDEELAKLFMGSPTLKAIHEILTKWGADHGDN